MVAEVWPWEDLRNTFRGLALVVAVVEREGVMLGERGTNGFYEQSELCDSDAPFSGMAPGKVGLTNQSGRLGCHCLCPFHADTGYASCSRVKCLY